MELVQARLTSQTEEILLRRSRRPPRTGQAVGDGIEPFASSLIEALSKFRRPLREIIALAKDLGDPAHQTSPVVEARSCG